MVFNPIACWGSDIEASSVSGWNSSTGSLPIGNFSASSTGRFDGVGLAINRPTTNYVGLFGDAASGATHAPYEARGRQRDGQQRPRDGDGLRQRRV